MVAKLQSYLAEEVVWEKSLDPLRPYAVEIDGEHRVIRLNDFPDEHLYTLIVDEVEIADFSDWPEWWRRP
jgi:hypothetical protein